MIVSFCVCTANSLLSCGLRIGVKRENMSCERINVLMMTYTFLHHFHSQFAYSSICTVSHKKHTPECCALNYLVLKQNAVKLG